jgi:hypothetical protein
MSLYKDASLVMIPTAYKDGRLYSIRPTDGSGDFGFSRGSNLAATRVDVNGLIEKGRENLLLQSNRFDTTWSIGNYTSIVSGQSGYDGTNDAWLWTAANGTFTNINQTNLIGSGVVTLSVYVKAANTHFVALQPYGSGSAYIKFNLSTGAVHETFGSPIDYGIEAVSGGWYRCYVTDTYTSSQVSIYLLDAAGNFANTSTDSIYIQDAQLEQGLVATDYIETGASTAQAGILEDMPRLDYSGGASCPSLLLEPQRTNVLLSSEDWTTNWIGSNRLVTANEIISPDGYQNADKLSAVGGGAYYAQVRTTASGANTFSVFLKYGDQTTQSIYAYSSGSYFARATFNLQTGTITSTSSGTASIEDYGNGWYRCIVSGTAITSTIEVGIEGIAVGAYTYAWGAQLESGSYPTSYIPTYGTSQTRSADSCLATGVSDLIGQTEGTLFVEYNSNVTEDDSFFIVADDGTANNRIVLYSNTPNNLALVINNGGVLQVVIANITLATGTNKFAVGYANNDVVLYLNGTQVGIDNTATIPATSALRMGTDNTGAAYASGKATKQALVFKTRLSNAELAALTTL